MDEHKIRESETGHSAAGVSGASAGSGSGGCRESGVGCRDRRGQVGRDAVAPSRKDRERAMHREQILEAARNLLGRKAYSEITVQEIAADAEFSVGYIYKIFTSKEDIYVTLVRRLGDDLVGLLDKGLAAQGDFEARLSTFVQSLYVWLDANPAFTASRMHEIHCLAHTLPRLEAVHHEREEILRARIRPFFEAGIRAGVIEGDLELMTKTLRALVWGFVGEDLFHGGTRGEWAKYAPIVVRAFLRTFAPEAGTEYRKEAPSR
jgi:AcrR family transcriptional regulator